MSIKNFIKKAVYLTILLSTSLLGSMEQQEEQKTELDLFKEYVDYYCRSKNTESLSSAYEIYFKLHGADKKLAEIYAKQAHIYIADSSPDYSLEPHAAEFLSEYRFQESDQQIRLEDFLVILGKTDITSNDSLLTLKHAYKHLSKEDKAHVEVFLTAQLSNNIICFIKSDGRNTGVKTSLRAKATNLLHKRTQFNKALNNFSRSPSLLEAHELLRRLACLPKIKNDDIRAVLEEFEQFQLPLSEQELLVQEEKLERRVQKIYSTTRQNYKKRNSW